MRSCCVALRTMSSHLWRSMIMGDKRVYTCMCNWVTMLYSRKKLYWGNNNKKRTWVTAEVWIWSLAHHSDLKILVLPQLWLGFSPWTQNFCMPLVLLLKQKQNQRKLTWKKVCRDTFRPGHTMKVCSCKSYKLKWFLAISCLICFILEESWGAVRICMLSLVLSVKKNALIYYIVMNWEAKWG